MPRYITPVRLYHRPQFYSSRVHLAQFQNGCFCSNNCWLKTTALFARDALQDPALVYKAGPQFGVSGIDDDLVVATRKALREMVDWLTQHMGMTP